MQQDARSIASWIAGLHRENSDALGFVPEPMIERYYVGQDRYVLQRDERGRPVGYLLHGSPVYGRALGIVQHCIQLDRREHGYGEAALAEVIERARLAGVSVLTAGCATNLPSLGFWLAQGFQVRAIEPGGKRRGREIARLWLPVNCPMFDEQEA